MEPLDITPEGSPPVIRPNKEIQINGNSFKIYNLDTHDSIIGRIASKLKTLPKYIYFTNGKPDIITLKNNSNIEVEDLLNTIKTTPNFSTLLPKITGKNNLDPITDVINPFVVYNKSVSDIEEDFRDAILLSLSYNINNSDFIQDDIDTTKIWEDRTTIKRNLDRQIDSVKKKAADKEKLFKEFDKSPVKVNYTDFELQKVQIEIRADIKEMTILEIFNLIKLTPEVPFATVRGFFKILKDFTPPPDPLWSISLEDGIILKVLKKKHNINVKPENYTDLYITIEKNILTLSFELDIIGDNLSRDLFIERILEPIDLKLNITIEEKQVKGVFYFPKHLLDKYVFSDLVMNDPLFSNLLNVDESIKATKDTPGFYTHFEHPSTGHITVNITEKIMDKADTTMKGKNQKLFPVNSKYVRVKISRVKDTKSVGNFQLIFAKLLGIYDSKFREIVNFYRQFPELVEFGKVIEAPKPIVKKLKLKDIVPDIILPNYTRKCTKLPTIISDEEAEEAERKGKKVMSFPKQAEGEPRNYICNYSKHIYPGLRDNPLSNSDKFPYLPCCYPVDHENKTGSKYRRYFYGEEMGRNELKQQTLIITEKIAQDNMFGTLPYNISRMFEIIDPDERYEYRRKGVPRNKSSFLYCVVEALIPGFLRIKENKRERELLKIRASLAVSDLASTCRQEMYDYSTQEIIDIIKNPEEYLSPRLFVHLLEVKYNCNIYIFTRDTINGELIIPRHKQAYYKLPSSGKSVFVFEHMGSESDEAKYPQCELIIKHDTLEEVEIKDSFTPQSSISKGVKKIFDTLRKSFILTREIPSDIDFPWKKDIKIISQGLDSYGKTRILNIEYSKKLFTILTSPLQPMQIKETTSRNITPIDIKTAIKFINHLNMSITDQTVIDGQVKEISVVNGNIIVYIPIDNGKIIKDVPKSGRKISYPDQGDSFVGMYNNNKKLARYILAYFIWLYSKYLHSNNIDTIKSNDMIKFRNSKITIIEDYEYESNIPKTFSTKSSLMKGGKLIVNDRETLKRLFYVLRLELGRNKSKILEYHNRTDIEEYYMDITDFSPYILQVILQGDESVIKWIEEQKISYMLYNSIRPGSQHPYFFKNPLIDDKVHLLQNTDTLQKAIEISQTWSKKRYNPDKLGEGVDLKYSYTLYSYVNAYDIEHYKIDGIDNPYNIKIIGYKIDDVAFYTSILNI